MDLALRTAERTLDEHAYLKALARAGDELAAAACDPNTEASNAVCVEWLVAHDSDYREGGLCEATAHESHSYWANFAEVDRFSGRFGIGLAVSAKSVLAVSVLYVGKSIRGYVACDGNTAPNETESGDPGFLFSAPNLPLFLMKLRDYLESTQPEKTGQPS